MSIKVMSHVWEYSQAKEGTLLVLLAIADFADDSGRAYPAILRLAIKARLSERQTQRAIHDLVLAGELTIERQAHRYGTNIYTVCMQSRGDILSPLAGVTSTNEVRGDAHVTPGVTPMSPYPSLEPSLREPSLREPPIIPLKKGDNRKRIPRDQDSDRLRYLRKQAAN